MNTTELIIHVGYPKTGSSTLQFGLFKNLDEINHLRLKTWRQETADEPLEDRLSSLLFLNRPISSKYKDLEAGKLNIISDESLTAPLRLRRNNFGDDIVNPMNFPALLKAEFEKDIEQGLKVKILVVIRNQIDLLYSQYVEEYKLVLYKSIDILHDSEGKIDLHGMDIYDYSAYLESLKKSFGKDNIIICLFEDLKHDPDTFIKNISSVVSYDPGYVAEVFSKTHINKKEKSPKGYITEVSEIQVDYFSDDKKAQIKSRFAESNTKLMNDWGISQEKLYKYGYI